MGKITGFIDYKRKNFFYKKTEERVKHYNEFISVRAEKELRTQGARCMDCGIPFCHSVGCPVFNLIPDWNDLVYRNNWREAYEQLEKTNNLPEITGRVCPAPCEAACTLSINSSPVTIKQIELAIIENAFKKGWVEPKHPLTESGKKVAIVGSGPAGLSAAQQLRRRGHKVVVFEKDSRAGGLLRYGIPDFKLEKWVIDRRIEQMELEGIEFETDVVIGEDLSAHYLKKTFDAILLATGAGEPRNLDIPGRGFEGIYFAMDYLKMSNKYIAGELKEHEIINARDKTVLVIGGGDTGSDCVGTANRQGAKEVYQFEILPEPMAWKEEWNPVWPEWPDILRTTTSHEEGCKRKWGILTKKFTGRDIKLERIHYGKVNWIKNEGTGKMKMVEVPGSDFTLEADLVFLAMGFLHAEHNRLLKHLGIVFDGKGNINISNSYATNIPGVYAAGDASLGASLVVRAIYHGRKAAEEINRFLIK
jgi:glutamate synthase (NADPH/NADH) small chain